MYAKTADFYLVVFLMCIQREPRISMNEDKYKYHLLFL